MCQLPIMLEIVIVDNVTCVDGKCDMGAANTSRYMLTIISVLLTCEYCQETSPMLLVK